MLNSLPDNISSDETSAIHHLCENLRSSSGQTDGDLSRLLEFVPRALDTLTRDKQPMRRIPVTESLPEVGQRVVCYCGGGKPFIGWLTKIQTWVPCMHNRGHDVTHWYPIPSAEE